MLNGKLNPLAKKLPNLGAMDGPAYDDIPADSHQAPSIW